MMLGYLQSQNRVFLIDKAQHVISFKLLASVLQYQAAVLAGRLEDARMVFPHVRCIYLLFLADRIWCVARQIYFSGSTLGRPGTGIYAHTYSLRKLPH